MLLAVVAALAGEPEVVVPRPPPVIVLGRRWLVLDARVGDPLEVRLVDPVATSLSFSSRYGPPGLDLRPDGVLSWVPEVGDVGRWRVSIRLSGGNVPRWTGLVLRVWPREDSVVGPVLDAIAPVAEGEPAPRRGIVAGGGCHLGFGVTGAVGRAGGTFWENVGDVRVRGSVSPHGSLACSGGGEVSQWVVGLDSAPFLTWPRVGGDTRLALAALLGGQVGGRRWKVGPYVTAGAIVVGAGVRTQWLVVPAQDGRPTMGVEGRLTWLAPEAAGSATVAWLWTL